MSRFAHAACNPMAKVIGERILYRGGGRYRLEMLPRRACAAAPSSSDDCDASMPRRVDRAAHRPRGHAHGARLPALALRALRAVACTFHRYPRATKARATRASA